jgi:pimeloyl-ACP methyl ester carboxylesterase/DNA-binding CsgD family transcriptional regulator
MSTTIPPPQKIRFCRSRDGIRIAYAICGSGPPLIKAPHPISHLNFDWDSPVWRHWLALFANRHTLIRYDLRGCGLSDRDNVEFHFERYVEDLEAVIDAAGVERFAVFGMDGGAATSVAYAAHHPNRVTHLALLNAYSRARLARNPTPKEVEETELTLKSIELGFDFDSPGLRQLYGAIRMPGASSEQFRSFSDLTRLATTPSNLSRALKAYFQVDLSSIAPNVQCPTLIAHVRQDAAIPFNEGRALAGLIPDASFIPLESPNHFLVEGEQAWTQLAESLTEFLPVAPAKPLKPVEALGALTAREHQVLELVAQGHGNMTIAGLLGISERTARNHVSLVFGKLGVNSRAQAIVRAREAGFGQKKSPRSIS